MTVSQPYQVLNTTGQIQLVYAANATGYANSAIFTVGRGVHGSVLVQVILDGSVSACTFTLDVSLVDGQWNALVLWDAIATPVVVLPIASGAIQRLNCTNFVGTGTVSVWGGMTQVETSDVAWGGGGGGGGGSVTQGTVPWVVSGQVTITQGGNQATVSAGGALKVDGSSVVQPTEDAADGIPGDVVPIYAEQIAGADSTGKLRTILTDVNGNIGVINPAVGLVGHPVPLSAMLIGLIDPSGNLIAAKGDVDGRLEISGIDEGTF